jgi:WD40 repeat protein/predicted Ser/Thr protein kinase
MTLSPLAPGDPRQMGEFWLAGRLGEGGQGVVYEAYDAAGSRVAIKVLHGNVAGDGATRSRFAREVVAAQRVASFCTARVVAADLEATRPYIVSEYVNGPSLKQAVEKDGAFDPASLHRLAIGMCTALTAIHGAGVVHRDLKPHNVLLGPDGPRVIDFGIARTEEMTRSVTGQVMGTPRYMAPEIFNGRPARQPADVWAWGAVVMFAATGRDPFDGDELPAVMHRVLSDVPDLGMLDDPLRSLVAAALAKEPAARPSAQQLLLGLVGGRDEAGALLAEGSRAATGALALPRQNGAPSLAETAERVYQGLPPKARAAVPQILLRMVTPGEGAEDALRDVEVDELLDVETGREPVEGVLVAFAEAGLLIRDDTAVRLTNAALLRAWPRMRDWVETDRDGLRTHHALADAARLWHRHGRKPSDLYQGTALDRAVAWAARVHRNLILNLVEQAFMGASLAHARTRARRRSLFTAALAALLVIALTAVGLAVKSATDADRQRRLAISRQLAAESESIGESDPFTSARLATAAWHFAATPEARHSMLTALTRPGRALLPGAGDGPVAFTADGKTLATASSLYGTDKVSLWDMATRRQIGVLQIRDPTGIKAMAFSANGNMLLTATGAEDGESCGEGCSNSDPFLGADESVRLWNVATRRQMAAPLTVRAKPEFTAVALSPDRKILATGRRGKTLQLWSLNTGRRIGASLPVRRVDAVAFSPDSKTIATTSEDHTLRLWSVASHRQIGRPLTSRTGGADVIAFSPDGATLATGGPDKTVKLWNTATHRRIGAPLVGHTRKITALAFSPDGTTLATGSDDNTVRLWNTATHRQSGAALIGHTSPIRGAAFSPDGNSLVTSDQDSNVRIWDVKIYRQEGSPLDGHAGAVTQVAFSPDGTTLATGSDDNTVRLWNSATHRQSGLLPIVNTRTNGSDAGVDGIAFSRDGTTLATGRNGDNVMIWKVAGRREIGTLRTGCACGEYPVAFSPDGTMLATGRPGKPTIHLWNLTTRRQTAALDTSTYYAMAFSPDNKILAATSEDGTIRLWDVTNNRQIGRPLMGHTGTITAMTFSPNGAMLATGSADNTARLWNPATQRPTGTPLAGHTDAVNGIAFSPDATTLATGSDDGTTRLWNVATQRQIGAPLTDHTKAVYAVAFSPGRRHTRHHQQG